jgi:methanogenic corrinoid protein MtbC1
MIRDLVDSLSTLRDRFLAAQLDGDRREAVRLVSEEGIGRGIGARDLHLHVIASAQREIGRLWQENRITVADEHQATAISQLALATIYAHLDRAPTCGKKVLVACVEGELHDMAARIVSDFLDAEGFDVTFLGASVPTKSLLEKIGALRPDLAALSVTMTFHLASAIDAAAAIRRAYPDVAVLVGGEALIGTPAAFVDGVEVGRGTAVDVIASVRSALGVAA